MIHRTHHLPEERLLEYYRAARAGEPIDPPAAEHLTDCAECGAQYAEIAQFLDVLRQEAEHETNEVFTSDWLHAQHVRIAHRLEHVGRPACVIRFPARTATATAAAGRSHGATRWIAAAAAAGLFIGVGLGVLYDSGRLARREPRSAAASAAAPATPTGLTTPAEAADEAFLIEAADEAFLIELELAADRPHTRALAPFDALTPQLLEAAYTVR